MQHFAVRPIAVCFFEGSHMKMSRKHARGFSLIELVIVVVIIAIIGAIAIPKMSRGAQGAGDSALLQDLSILRSAVDLYNAEHSAFPLTITSDVKAQLTSYSDASGNTNGLVKSPSYPYGPYLKAPPALPVGTQKGQTAITNGASTTAGTVATAGWLFNGTDIIANLGQLNAADKDAAGVWYNTY